MLSPPKYRASVGRRRLLRQVAREIGEMARRMGWETVRIRGSDRTGSRYLRLRFPNAGHACIRVADHYKPDEEPDPKRYEWILTERWGQPLTDLREWLWHEARRRLIEPPRPYRPKWPPPRFNVRSYLEARERMRTAG